MKDENIFGEKLYHHTMPVRDGLWEAIEAQLPPKKNRKAFPLFWFTLFATTLLGAAMMIGLLSKKESGHSPKGFNETITLSSSRETAPEVNGSNDSQSTLNSNIPAAVVAPSVANENTPGSATSPKKRTPQHSTPFSKSKLLANTASGLAHTATAVDASSSTDEVLSRSAAISLNEFNTLPFLTLQEVSIGTEESVPAEMAGVKPDPNCYKFNGPGKKYAISADFFGGPGFSPRTYELNDTEASIYADARRATESYQYAWSAGTRINLHLRSGLKGSLGFLYTQAGDVFDYTDSLATQSTTRIDSFFAADGTFLYEETSQVLILGTLIKKIHNTYTYIDIPLVVGYELPMGRSTLMVNAGPVFNLSSSHEGQILDTMLHPRSITNGEPGAIDVYKTNLGLSIYLGAGILFPLTDHLSGLVEPSFLYRLDPVTLDTYPLREHRHYAGLNLGIRYHFN